MMSRRIWLALGLSALLLSCHRRHLSAAQEQARSLPAAEAMALFDHSGNAALRKRVTLDAESRDAFILFPGQELVDKQPAPAQGVLTLAAGVIALTKDPLPIPLPKLRLTLTSDSSTPASHQLILTLNRGAWLEQVFSLDELAGQTLTIRIQAELGKETEEPLAPGFAFAIGNPLLLSRVQPQPAKRLNLILIAIDTLRPSHLSLFGYPRRTSPYLDGLAQEGVLFEKTLSQASWTPPSVGTLFTSLYPPQHGSLGKDHIPLPAANTTLAETLRRAGYRTAAFSASPFITPDYGFGQGFEVFDVIKEKHAPALNASALPWLDLHRREPFFLYLMYFDPHHPYQPPAPFDQLFQHSPNGKPLWNPDHFQGDPPPVMKLDQSVKSETFEYLRSQYDGEIAAADQGLRDLFAHLRSLDLLEHSVVIITSDHGEEFLDHGRFGHGRSLYEEMLRVLLFVRVPGLPHPGFRVTRTVRVLDIMPTALEILGVPPAAPLEGQSLVPFLADPQAQPDRDALASMQFLTETGRTGRSLRQGNLKLILSTHPDAIELYDLSTDPGETHNLAPARPDQVRRLTDRITDLEKTMKVAPSGATLNPPTAETKKLLKSLGYVQ